MDLADLDFWMSGCLDCVDDADTAAVGEFGAAVLDLRWEVSKGADRGKGVGLERGLVPNDCCGCGCGCCCDDDLDLDRGVDLDLMDFNFDFQLDFEAVSPSRSVEFGDVADAAWLCSHDPRT